MTHSPATTAPAPSEWLVLQLADSAFPTGGFAHSGGLEAAVQLGEVDDSASLRRFVEGALWQAGAGALPLIGGALDSPERLGDLDALCHAFLSNHVANRASRVQGRAFVATSARSFPEGGSGGPGGGLAALDEAVRRRVIHGHLAPVFGVVLGGLGVERARTQALFLHLTLRGVVSAAVRLGRIGPHEAQRLQFECGPLLDQVMAATAALGVEELAQTAPIVELVGGLHDRLYSKLFQS